MREVERYGRSLVMRLLCLILFFVPLWVLRAEPSRPNIVFILVDDLRWNALGCYGDKIVQTPNIDRLAAEGTLFKNAFVTTSICSVSRASIFSGQWMRRHGIVDFATGFTDGAWAQTYPAGLQKTGYKTAFVGKFGVGNLEEVSKRSDDFDVWRGDERQGGRFFIEKDDPTRTHKTAKMGNDAVAFLQSAESSKPFCLSLSFNAVHARDRQPREYEPDLREEELYKDITIPLPPLATGEAFQRLPSFVQTSEGRTRWHWRFDDPEKAQGILRDYYRLITGVDREVGRIRDVLQERGLAANTVIIFTSDNGYALADRGLADKWFMWEEDIRVPLIICDPRAQKEQRGRVEEAMVLNVDIAPTLLDLGGVQVPAAMQGRSLAPLLRGDVPAGWRTEFFYEHHSVPKLIPQCEGIRTEHWKYIRWIKSEPLVEELYDLKADPLEEQNLATEASHAGALAELRSKWENASKELR